MHAPRLTLPAGHRLSWHDVLDSTSEEAKRRAQSGEEGPLWIVAERQTHGRGRLGRSWESPRGNLAATLLMRREVPAVEAARLSFLAALATADMLDGYLPGVATFKWPNDVLIRGRKIAGVLLETGPASGAQSWISLGVGVNLASCPQETHYPATSLVAEGIAAPLLEEAFARLAKAFHARLQAWRDGGFSSVRQAWLARAAGLGEPIRVQLCETECSGRFAGIDETGALLLDTGAESLRGIQAGDVFFGAERSE